MVKTIIQNFAAQRYAHTGLLNYKSAFKERFWCKIKVVNKASAVIRVRSYGLLLHGFNGIRRELCNVLDQLAVDKSTGYVPDWNEYARLCRVDIFADVAWRGRFKQEQFKTRLRKLFYAKSGESARGETFAYGDRSIFACRVYHKSSEIDVHNKQYMRSIWEAVGHIDNDDVQRVEFEHRSKKLDEIYPGRTLGQVGEDTFSKLWSYDLDTIEYMAERAKNRNLHKKKRHPVWKALRNTLYTEYPELTKKQFEKAKRDYYYTRARKNTLRFLTFDYHDFYDVPLAFVDKFNFTKEEFRVAKIVTSEGFLLHDWSESIGVEVLGNADFADYNETAVATL